MNGASDFERRWKNGEKNEQRTCQCLRRIGLVSSTGAGYRSFVDSFSFWAAASELTHEHSYIHPTTSPLSQDTVYQIESSEKFLLTLSLIWQFFGRQSFVKSSSVLVVFALLSAYWFRSGRLRDYISKRVSSERKMGRDVDRCVGFGTHNKSRSWGDLDSFIIFVEVCLLQRLLAPALSKSFVIR